MTEKIIILAKTLIKPYISPIMAACFAFPFVAALFTLPFAIKSYRKYGGITILRTFIEYSFILYLMCSFLLTVLPLPSISSVALSAGKSVNKIPFSNLEEGLKEFDIILRNPATWHNLSGIKHYLMSAGFFQIIANIMMLVPLGIYLHYYFRCGFFHTAFLGFLLSLFFEVVQYTGLFFIYPKPYRCPDVNDLMANTLGAVIGYIFTPLFTFMLPSREDIDKYIVRKGEKVTLMRQLFAGLIDWTIIAFITTFFEALWDYVQLREFNLDFHIKIDFFWVLIYFCMFQYMLKGFTPGKRLLRIRCINVSGEKTPGPFQYLKRYFYIYVIYPIFFFGNMLVLGGTAILFFTDCDADLKYLALLLTLFAVLSTTFLVFRSISKHHLLPHDAKSGMRIVLYKQADEEI